MAAGCLVVGRLDPGIAVHSARTSCEVKGTQELKSGIAAAARHEDGL
jgi:hypothetical protein